MIPEERQMSLGENDYNWILRKDDGSAVNFSAFRERAVFLKFLGHMVPSLCG